MQAMPDIVAGHDILPHGCNKGIASGMPEDVEKDHVVTITIQWITTDEQLAAACARWQQLSYVALDTEFMRTDTFYPQAGLLQVADGQQVWLVDPLLIRQWQPLAGLLGHPQVIKVLHACSEDLEVLLRLTGQVPRPLFDTQLAAAYLNMGFSMGYSRLVEQVLGVELPKGETRSDWLQRPLSGLQVCYAAEDVHHLAALYLQLAARLTPEKLGWLLEDGAGLALNAVRETCPDELYQEIKQAWRLNSRQLAVLRVLAAWREREARRRDQPRNRIIRESCLWALARYQPGDLGALSRIEDMHPRTVRQDGPQLLELIRQALALPAADCPPPLPAPLPLEAGALLKKLRAVGTRLAGQLQLAPELMLRKKVLESLLKSGYPDGPYQLPDSLTGWRRALMGRALLDVLENHS